MDKRMDSICAQIYSCIPSNRKKFDKLMKDLDDEILNSSPNNFQSNNFQGRPNDRFDYFNYKNINQPNINLQGSYSNFSNKSPNRMNNSFNNFSGKFNSMNNFNPMNSPEENYEPYVITAPEAEFLNLKTVPNNPKSVKRNYNDVHANSKFYYPDEYERMGDNLKDMQWTDRANNINLMYKSIKPENKNEDYGMTNSGRDFYPGGNSRNNAVSRPNNFTGEYDSFNLSKNMA
ncbi:MAG: hypothetical protein MJ252_17135 [archaeon]|nr:hypothetical protein [archaeon]